MFWRCMTKFSRTDDGVVAILFALMFSVLVILGGLAIDLGRYGNARSSLQDTVDAAVLAAATSMLRDNTVDQTERFETAKKIVDVYMTERSGGVKINNFDYSFHALEDSVAVNVTADLATTLGRLVVKQLPLNVNAKALIRVPALPPCIVALNSTTSEAFLVSGSANVVAEDCAVVSNSKHEEGMATSGSASATAAVFCSAGGAVGGGFSPEAEEMCWPYRDPYASRYAADDLIANGVNVDAPCTYNKTLRVKNEQTFDAGGPSKVMVFCNGLNVQAGGVATLKPGVYVIYGELEVGSNSTLNAPEGVTLYLADGSEQPGLSTGYLTVRSGASFNLISPMDGYLDGIAILQPSSSQSSLTHKIISGGLINIEGVVYTPDAEFVITGNGVMNGSSNYFQLIADTVLLDGNGALTLHYPYNADRDALAKTVAYYSNQSVALVE